MQLPFDMELDPTELLSGEEADSFRKELKWLYKHSRQYNKSSNKIVLWARKPLLMALNS